jgi:hypothetical protein
MNMGARAPLPHCLRNCASFCGQDAGAPRENHLTAPTPPVNFYKFLNLNLLTLTSIPTLKGNNAHNKIIFDIL